MTSILIDLKTDAPAGPVGLAGSLIATPSRIRIDEETVTLPSAMVFVVPGDGPALIELPQPDSTWFYWLDLYVDASLQIRRSVTFTGSGPVAWADLVDVDPDTYEPLDPAAPGVNELLAVVAALSTSAGQAVVTANAASAALPRNPLVVGDDLTFALADGTPINAGNVRGPQGLAGAGVPWGTSLGNVSLDTITTPGVYRQITAANATLANAYPYAGNIGVLEVFEQTGTNNVIQRFTAQGGVSGNMRGIYQRRRNSTVWDAWQYIARQRVADGGTAGRAIYTWDDVNGRDQLIYGDTGLRNILADLVVGATAASLQLRRVGQLVELSIDTLAVTASGTITVYTLPVGFRPSGTRRNVISSTGGPSAGRNLLAATGGAITLGAAATGETYNTCLTFFTSDAWPATLPGAALGTIPNL